MSIVNSSSFLHAYTVAKDCMEQMFEFLEFTEIIRCMCIHPVWIAGILLMKRGRFKRDRMHLERWVDSSNTLMAKLMNQPATPTVPNHLVSQLIHRHARHLWLRQCDDDTWLARYIEWFRLMNQPCAIETLQLDSLTAANTLHLLNTIVPQTPHLKHLNLNAHHPSSAQYIKTIHQQNLYTSLQPIATQLKSLEINCVFPFHALFQNESQLAALTLHDEVCPVNPTPHYLVYFVAYWNDIGNQWGQSAMSQSLKQLNLSYMFTLYSTALLTMVRALPCLEVLKMIGCMNVSVEFYEQMRCSELHTLYATHLLRSDGTNRLQANRQMVAIAKLPSLRSLVLNSTQIVADVEWPVLLSSCTTLRELVALDADCTSLLHSQYESQHPMSAERLRPFHSLVQLESLRITNHGVGNYRTSHPFPYQHYKRRDPLFNVVAEDVINLVSALPALHSLWLNFNDGLYVTSNSLKPLRQFAPRFQNLLLRNDWEKEYNVEVCRHMRQRLTPIKCNETWKNMDWSL